MGQSFIIKDSRSIDKMFHTSTESVVDVLQQLQIVTDRTFTALDLGTGSGILAMIIAQKWLKSKVIATDISKQAVQDAQINISKNGFESQIKCIQAVGVDHPQIKNNAPYALLTANLVAKYHVEYVAEMQRLITDDGIIVLSGILVWRLQEVERALEYTSLMTVAKIENQGWLTLILQLKQHTSTD